MRGIIDVPARLRKLTLINQRNWAWLSRSTGIPVAVVLGEVAIGDVPITITHALAYADAFGLSLGELIDVSPVDVVAARAAVPMQKAA